MLRRSHCVLSVLVLVLALSVGWLLCALAIDGESVTASKPRSLLGPGSGRSEDPTGSSTLISPSSEAEAQALRTLAPRSASAARVPAAISEAELAGALWVRGRVRIPAGTPADERAEVVADGRAFESGSVHRAPIAADKSFRVAFSRATTHGRLRVEGRYLFSPEPLDLVATDPPENILLEPALGGCIRGHFSLPADALSLAAAVPGTIVELRRCSSHTGPVGFRRDLAVRTESDLDFEIDHLAATSCWAIRARPEGFVPIWLDELALKPGAITEVAIELRVGLRIAGRVQWPDGRPAVACAIDLAQPREGSDSFSGTARDRQATAAGDGSFVLTGLEAGPCTITAHAAPVQKSEDAHEDEHAAEPQAADPAQASPTPILEAAPRSGSEGEWVARIEGVAAGRSDIVLVLHPGSSIEGRVVDDAGRPIESFTIEAHPVGQGDRGRSSSDSISKSFRDAHGGYRWGGFHAGAWRLSARAPGFASARLRTIEVTGDARTADFVLQRVASLSGSVTDAAGQPVAGAKVRIAMVGDGAVPGASMSAGEPAEPGAWSSPSRDLWTDESGRFEGRDLWPGSLRLVASAPDWADSAPLAIEIRPAEIASGLVLVLRAGGRLTGEVFDSRGRPDANRPLVLFARGSIGRQREIAADASGRILVEHLAPDTYDIQTLPSPVEIETEPPNGAVSSATETRQARVKIQEGATAHVTLGAPSSHPVRVHGVVTSGGAPVAGLHLDIQAQLDGGESVHHSTSSDARGRYEVVLEEPGDWGFFLRLANGTSSGRHETIPAVASFELDIALPSGTIRGRVIDPEGQPAPGILVSLSMDPGTAELTSVAAGGCVQSDASGRFRFDSLPAGTFALSTHSPRAPRSEAAGETAPLGPAHRDGLALPDGGELGDVELRLERAGRIEGVVLGPLGSPLANARVFVRDERGSIVSPHAPASSDAKGCFAVRGLAPGRFTVLARTESLCSSESAAVTVRADDGVEVELSLQPAARLRVIVEDERGEAIGARVEVVDALGRDFGPLDPAGEDGPGDAASSPGREFGPLPPGAYSLRATNHDRTSAAAEARVGPGGQKTVTLRFGG